jgi:putative glutamine amidotransferase
MPDEDLDALLERIGGLILIGGNDYSPALYGETKSDKVQLIDPQREEFDLRLVKKALARPKLPLLGICGGLQLLNIGLGGSLIQDIPSLLPDSEVKHRKPNPWQEGFQQHHILLEPETKLHALYRVDSLEVNSFHHQAIKVLGEGLVVSAQADDGVIEAVELPNRDFTLAVQWHPERDFDGNRALFEQFVKACSRAVSGVGSSK